MLKRKIVEYDIGSKNFTFLYLRFTLVNISRCFSAYFLRRLSLYLIFSIRFFPHMK